MAGSYMEVAVTGDPDLLEHLLGLLSQLGFEGFWEDGGTLRGYIAMRRWTPALREEILRVIAMVTPAGVSARPVVTVSALDDRNWNAEWERTIRPIRVTDRIVIRPSWQEYVPASGEIVLVIDPKMSFGTGYHESTRLSLRLMERHLGAGVTVLDAGTGTGVLAIAAVRLGAIRAVGTDVDEWSIANAAENIRLNGLDGRIAIHEGDLGPLGPERFGLIVANIQRNVLEELLPDFARLLSPSGVLLLSGLLEGDADPMEQGLRSAGFVITDRLRENEWIALAARRDEEP